MNKQGFALIESILLFAGAILLCSCIISSFFSNQHFEKLVDSFKQKNNDELLEALYQK